MPQQFVEQQQQQQLQSHLISGYGMNAAAIIPRISPVAPAAAAAASVITPTTPTAIPNNMINIVNNNTTTNNNSGASSNSSTPNATNGSRVQQQQQQQQQQKNPKLYKTELCRSWMENGRCNYGERCQYAHGDREKRPVPRHPKYKTDPCQSYHKTGYCPYGPRCHFVHNESPTQLKGLIAANEQALRMVQEFATLGDPEFAKKSHLTSSSSASSLGTFAQQQQQQQRASPYACGIGQQQQHQPSRGQPTFMIRDEPLFPAAGKALSFGSNPADTSDSSFFNSFNSLSNGVHKEANIGKKNCCWSDYHGPPNAASLFDQHQRPKTLDLFYTIPNSNQSQQISPIFHTPFDEIWAIPSLGKSPLASSPLGSLEKAEKLHESRMVDELLDAQQLLGNLCSSDDDYSRSSIISSNIDSGNESPLATFDEDSMAKLRMLKETQQQQRHKSQSSALPPLSSASASADESQQRRSSDGDKSTNNAQECVNTSTASSSMASLLSSASSSLNPWTQQQQQQKHAALEPAAAGDAISSNYNSSTTTTITSAAAKSSSSSLPLFERLSLNP